MSRNAAAPEPGFPSEAMEQVVDAALAEDFGRGDPTSRLTVDADRLGQAAALAKSEIVVAGLDVFRAAFTRVDPAIAVQLVLDDGARATPGAVLARVAGPARSILAAERVALNLLQRLSGVATLTRRYVDAVPPGCATRILDTRKTTPGLRALERYAVRRGGGLNHRPDLAGGILIKTTTSSPARERRRSGAPRPSGADRPSAWKSSHLARRAGAGHRRRRPRRAARQHAPRPRRRGRAPRRRARRGRGLRGIKVADVPALARAGVDFISVGALTHSAPAADISLEFGVDVRSRTLGDDRLDIGGIPAPESAQCLPRTPGRVAWAGPSTAATS